MEKAEHVAAQRQKLISRMEELVRLSEAEERPMTDEDQTEFNAAASQVDELGKRHQALSRLEALAAAEAPVVVPGQTGTRTKELAVEPRSEGGDSQKLDYERGFKNWLLFPFGDVNPDESRYAERCGFNPNAKQIFIPFNRRRYPHPRRGEARERWNNYLTARDEMEKRAQSVGTTTAGGDLVADEMMLAIDVAMEANNSVRQAARVITTTTGGDLPIPTVTDIANDGVLLGENTEVAELDVTFSQVVLQAFKYSSKAVRVSRELLQDSNESIPGLIGDLLGERLGRIMNQHMTTGTGSSQPKGIVTAAGVATSGTSDVTLASPTVPTYPELNTILHTVNAAYRKSPSCGWMMSDDGVRMVKSVTDGNTRPYWLNSEPSAITGTEPSLLLGFPVYVNVDMASVAVNAKTILFGDFSKYYVREVAGIQIMRLDERYAEYDQVAFMGFARMDADMINHKAIAMAQMAAA